MTIDTTIEAQLWMALRRLTAARIGLERSGASLATKPLLELRLAHAQARDAVQEKLDGPRLMADLSGLSCRVVAISTAVDDRHTYLMRPDLGRLLGPDAEAALAPHRGDYDVVFTIADGLSARAVHRHARPVLAKTMTILRSENWRIAPLVIVRHGRVAIGDAIAAALRAACVAVLIGERPGLSASDSMGAYLTFKPHAGTTDADRNCISNIRPQGTGYEAAGAKLAYMLRVMRARRLSGVQLKDESDRPIGSISSW